MFGGGDPGSSGGGSLTSGAPASAGRGGLASLPWYVWLVLSATVIVGALLRSAIFEPAASKTAAPPAAGAAVRKRTGTKPAAVAPAKAPGNGAPPARPDLAAPAMAKATSPSGPPIP